MPSGLLMITIRNASPPLPLAPTLMWGPGIDSGACQHYNKQISSP